LSADSAKARELKKDPQVSVTYVGEKADRCIAISGRARLERNAPKMRALWKPLYKAWFPQGLADPDLRLLRVTIERAEYWKTPSSALVRVWGSAKALLTGESFGEQVGDHKQMSRKT